MTSKINYTHGDTGSKPPDGHDAQTGNAANPQYYDWYITNFLDTINNVVGEVDDILGGNVTVGEADKVDGWDKGDIKNWVNTSADVPDADYADDADQVDGQDWSDIKTWVNNSTTFYKPNGNDTFVLEKRTSDPSSATGGRMWYRTDKD